MKIKKDRERLIEKLSKILLVAICVVSSVLKFDKIVSANHELLMEHIEILNQHKEFIILFISFFQMLMAIITVYIDAVIIVILSTVILKRKEYIKTCVLPAIYGNIIAVLVNQIVLFIVDDYSLNALIRVNLIPIALISKTFCIFFVLHKIYKRYEKKECFILGGGYLVFMIVASVINFLTM